DPARRGSHLLEERLEELGIPPSLGRRDDVEFGLVELLAMILPEVGAGEVTASCPIEGRQSQDGPAAAAQLLEHWAFRRRHDESDARRQWLGQPGQTQALAAAVGMIQSIEDEENRGVGGGAVEGTGERGRQPDRVVRDPNPEPEAISQGLDESPEHTANLHTLDRREGEMCQRKRTLPSA